MPRQSTKKREERRDTDPHRRAYVREAGVCEFCRDEPPVDCHEIPAGSSRHLAVKLANTWLALCRGCHEKLQGLSFEEQADVKYEAIRWDINRCLGRDQL